MTSKEILSFIGIAKKANKLISGQDVVERNLISNDVFLVIISEDAAENTKEKFYGLCLKKKIPVIIWGESGELGKAIGKERRKVFGITHTGFAHELQKRINLLTGVGDIDEITSI
jgi:ribosomal protein L7Ae-like RNA K-turn-binding protein